MNRGRAVILNPLRPDSIKRREFVVDSLRRSALAYVETVEESRIVIEWEGVPKAERRRAATNKRALPPPVTVERAMRSRFECGPDEVEYWDEIIRLSAEREGLRVGPLKIRAEVKGEAERWMDTWGVGVGDYLAVNRVSDSWAITHVRTGLRAAQCSHFRDAVRVARDAATWPEWAAIHSKADITPEFKQKASAAFEVAA